MNSVVFLPGFMSDARLFRGPAGGLVADPVGSGRDIRGRRPTYSRHGGTGLTDLPDRSVLVGASLGGMVAMEVLRRAPERVAGLVLIATDALSELPAVAAGARPDDHPSKGGPA